MTRENQLGFNKTGRGRSIGVITQQDTVEAQHEHERKAELERQRREREQRERQGA